MVVVVLRIESGSWEWMEVVLLSGEGSNSRSGVCLCVFVRVCEVLGVCGQLTY